MRTGNQVYFQIAWRHRRTINNRCPGVTPQSFQKPDFPIPLHCNCCSLQSRCDTCTPPSLMGKGHWLVSSHESAVSFDKKRTRSELKSHPFLFLFSCGRKSPLSIPPGGGRSLTLERRSDLPGRPFFFSFPSLLLVNFFS